MRYLFIYLLSFIIRRPFHVLSSLLSSHWVGMHLSGHHKLDCIPIIRSSLVEEYFPTFMYFFKHVIVDALLNERVFSYYSPTPWATPSISAPPFTLLLPWLRSLNFYTIRISKIFMIKGPFWIFFYTFCNLERERELNFKAVLIRARIMGLIFRDFKIDCIKIVPGIFAWS